MLVNRQKDIVDNFIEVSIQEFYFERSIYMAATCHLIANELSSFTLTT